MANESAVSLLLSMLAAGSSELRQAYYSVLDADPSFVSDLEQLFNFSFPEYASERIARRQGQSTHGSRIRPRTRRQQAKIAGFATKWHLPAAYRWEIATSMLAACDPELPFR